MPFELTNAPATFMRTMNNLFSDLFDRGGATFMDHILIYIYICMYVCIYIYISTIEEHEI